MITVKNKTVESLRGRMLGGDVKCEVWCHGEVIFVPANLAEDVNNLAKSEFRLEWDVVSEETGDSYEEYAEVNDPVDYSSGFDWPTSVHPVIGSIMAAMRVIDGRSNQEITIEKISIGSCGRPVLNLNVHVC